MEMRVKTETLPPSVENGAESDFGVEVFRVAGNLLKRSCGAVEQEIIQKPAIAQCQRMQLVRKRKDDMPVRYGKQVTTPLLQPLGLLETLALRTMSVAAGVIGNPEATTSGALVHVSTERGGPALNDVPDNGLLCGGGAMGTLEVASVRTQDLSDLELRPGCLHVHRLPEDLAFRSL
jgi:hypothetical protein